MNRQKLFVAMAEIAVVVGAVIAVLFAPEKGSKLRKRIALRRRDLEDYLDEVVEKGKKAWREAKGEVKGNYQDFEEYMDHIVREGKKSWAKMKADLDQQADDTLEDEASYLNRLMDHGKQAWENLKQTAGEAVQEVGDVVRDKANEVRQTAREASRKLQNDMKDAN